MSAGPKAAVDPSPLPWRPRATGSARFALFCQKFIRVPKGTGALSPLRLRDWQRDLTGSVLDADPTPRIAGWTLPRGQGKSTLVAALGIYELMTGGEGATVIVAAVDERQAGIVFGIAKRMVELNDDLSSRVQIFKDRLVVPSRGAEFRCLPASPASLEGLDYTLAIVDEIGRVDPETWEVIALASGKRERSTLIGIGTPGPREDNVLAQLRAYAQDHPDDTSQVYREFSAAGFENDHPTDCQHCWELANPALDDFLHRDALAALQPPKMTEGNFRRARLCQFVNTNENPFVSEEVWDGLDTEADIAPGSTVVLALDGSFGGKDSDTTALLLATVDKSPHVMPLRVWSNPDNSPTWRVPLVEVMDEIRQACRTFSVKELVADPFRLNLVLQQLANENVPVSEFPHSPARLTKATTDLYSAAVNGEMSHNGDPALKQHVLNATVIEHDGGLKIGKASRRRKAGRVDLVACLVMAHSRATFLATRPVKRKRAWSFAA